MSTSRNNQLNEAAPTQQTGLPDLPPVPPSQRLPQSPVVTHPRSTAGKNRKPRVTPEEMSRLGKNPWAVLLASPIRACVVTGARLPSDLLGTWGLVRQPSTDTSVMMPVGLMQDSLQSSKPSQAGLEDGNEDLSSSGTPSPPIIPNRKPARPLVIRITELLPLIRSISVALGKTKWKRPPIMKLLSFRWKAPNGPITPDDELKLRWLKNTPEILLQGMRADVCKKLGYVFGKYKHVDTKNHVWSSLDLSEYSDAALGEALGKLEPFERMECGGVLLLGPKSAASPEDGVQAKSSLDTCDLLQTGSNVPVFDLSVLLSDSDLQTLRESHGQFAHNALFFRPDDKAGIMAMMSLWKIKRLLAGVDMSKI